MQRAFGTDTLNSANPLQGLKPDHSAAATGSAPSSSSSAMLGWSRNKTARRPGMLGDRLMAIDRSQPRDRSWLNDDAPARDAASPAAAPVCRNFVQDGYCAYGADCGFDHPAHAPSSGPARRISVPVLERRPSMPQRGRSPAPSSFRREPSVSASRSRRPSLAPAHSAPSVFEARTAPGQSAFLVAAEPQAHPDAPPAVPVLPPMFYATYRRGSNGEVLDPALIPHGVQAQKSLYYRTKPCRYWATEGHCPKAEKCTFIHDPALAAGTPTVPASPREQSPVRVQARTPVTPSPVPTRVNSEEDVPRVKRPSRLPPIAPVKPREPHPAWRVVGGGVPLAGAGGSRTEDQMDEDAVEQQLLEDVPASPAQETRPTQQQQQQVQAHGGFPAFALPAHAVYHAYAYPGPVAYEAPQPHQYQVQQQQPQYQYQQPQFQQQQVQYAQQQPQQFQQQPVQVAAGVPGFPGWTVHVVPPQPYYGAPMYVSQPSTPDGAAFEVVYPHQQRAPAPTPVLYGTTPSAYVYGLPGTPATVDALAGAGVDVSALDGGSRVFDCAEDGYDAVDPFDAYGVVPHPEDDEVEVTMGALAPSSSPVTQQPTWGFASKLSSWADEVEAADPDLEGVHDEFMDVDVQSSSWPTAITAPNSPRARTRLFQAEA